MCIICASPAGVKQPNVNTLRTMFYRNPHGAGYMFARDGKVTIHKGFMDFDSFLGAVRSEHFTKADSVVYHFRISTQAGVNPEMTHPFPLSNQPKRSKARMALTSNDNMVVDGNPERLCRVDDLLGHVDIGP